MSFADVKPPIGGAVRYQTVQAATASSAIEIDAQDLGYHTFISDVDFYVLFGGSAVAAPDETETVDGEVDIPWLIKANTPTHFRVDRSTRYFRHKGAGTAGILRFYKSGD